MNCIACKNNRRPTEKHHIKSRGSGGSDDDYNLLDLCRLCHTRIHTIGPTKFVLIFPHVKNLLEDKGWEFKETFGITKLVRRD